MGETEISWTHRPGTVGKTWNPIQGCRRVSPGCENCYAERIAARFAVDGWSHGLINLKTRKWNGSARLAAHKLAEPMSWRKPATVFTNSMSDLFYEGFTNEQIAAVFGVIAAVPQHTFQVLTKRAKRMREWFGWVTRAEPMFSGLPNYPDHVRERSVVCRAAWEHLHPSDKVLDFQRGPWPLPNVWLGVSVENQSAADERIPELLATAAAVRFLSCEPLIGSVDLDRWVFDRQRSVRHMMNVGLNSDQADSYISPMSIGWVIAGCESGPRARPCSVDWLRSLRDQCAQAGVPYFLKQADNAVGFGAGSKRKPGNVIELPYLDGVQHAAFPEAL